MNYPKSLMLIALFMIGAVVVKAQSSHVVSKGVQKYANKEAFAKQEKSEAKIKSVGTPSIAVSKGVQAVGNNNEAPVVGNMISTGFPYWAISKSVNHHHLEAENTDYYTRK